MSVKLSNKQKEEIRRLTQKANRRIIQAHKQYNKAGLEIAPREVVGDFQTSDTWETKGYPLSRSTSFKTSKEYSERIRFLRSFDGGRNRSARPTMTEYTEIQRFKVLKGVETSFGDFTSGGVNKSTINELYDQLNSLDAPELSKFWDKYSMNSSRKGLQYSSDVVMLETLQEFFGEDMQDLLDVGY